LEIFRKNLKFEKIPENPRKLFLFPIFPIFPGKPQKCEKIKKIEKFRPKKNPGNLMENFQFKISRISPEILGKISSPALPLQISLFGLLVLLLRVRVEPNLERSPGVSDGRPNSDGRFPKTGIRDLPLALQGRASDKVQLILGTAEILDRQLGLFAEGVAA
jgi:hypothetical protein